MPVVQVSLSEKARAFLEAKAPGRIKGRYLSELLVCESEREKFQQTLEAQRGAPRDAWETESGLGTVE